MTSPTPRGTASRSLQTSQSADASRIGHVTVCVGGAGDGERRLVRQPGFIQPGGKAPPGRPSQVGWRPRNLPDGPPPQTGSGEWNQSQLFPACRLFLVHGDGSAVEFLSSQTGAELLQQAHSDPAVALLKEPLPDCPGWLPPPSPLPGAVEGGSDGTEAPVSPPDEFGITVLRPGPRSVWTRWVLGKRAPDVTPQNLRNRSWADFPQTEVRRWPQARGAAPQPGP